MSSYTAQEKGKARAVDPPDVAQASSPSQHRVSRKHAAETAPATSRSRFSSRDSTADSDAGPSKSPKSASRGRSKTSQVSEKSSKPPSAPRIKQRGFYRLKPLPRPALPFNDDPFFYSSVAPKHGSIFRQNHPHDSQTSYGPGLQPIDDEDPFWYASARQLGQHDKAAGGLSDEEGLRTGPDDAIQPDWQASLTAEDIRSRYLHKLPRVPEVLSHMPDSDLVKCVHRHAAKFWTDERWMSGDAGPAAQERRIRLQRKLKAKRRAAANGAPQGDAADSLGESSPDTASDSAETARSGVSDDKEDLSEEEEYIWIDYLRALAAAQREERRLKRTERQLRAVEAEEPPDPRTTPASANKRKRKATADDADSSEAGSRSESDSADQPTPSSIWNPAEPRSAEDLRSKRERRAARLEKLKARVRTELDRHGFTVKTGAADDDDDDDVPLALRLGTAAKHDDERDNRMPIDMTHALDGSALVALAIFLEECINADLPRHLPPMDESSEREVPSVIQRPIVNPDLLSFHASRSFQKALYPLVEPLPLSVEPALSTRKAGQSHEATREETFEARASPDEPEMPRHERVDACPTLDVDARVGPEENGDAFAEAQIHATATADAETDSAANADVRAKSDDTRLRPDGDGLGLSKKRLTPGRSISPSAVSAAPSAVSADVDMQL